MTAWGIQVVLAAAASSLLAQPEVTIRTDARLVQLAVSVTRADDGQPVEALAAKDFVIRDDGRIRLASSFVAGESRPPLKLMVLVETSSAQDNAVDGLVDALPWAVGALRPSDMVGLASVFPGHKILLKPTLDRSMLPPALAQLKANQEAYLRTLQTKGKKDKPAFDFNDLTRALLEISKSEADSGGTTQFVTVLVTDDFDLLSPDESAAAAKLLARQRSGVAAFIDVQNTGIAIAKKNVHAIRLVTPMRLAVRDRGATFYASQTGGPIVTVRNRDYRTAMDTLLRSLSHAYLIGFTPPENELDGRYHKLSISIKPGRVKGKVRIAHRAWYWADK